MRYGSLFSGVGGMDLGFDDAGHECGWQVEIDARCRSVLEHRWPGVPRHCDVRLVDGHTLPPVDVITYGFPCQDLSIAGAGAGLNGARSGLFFEAMRVIREMREETNGRYPAWAVAENVPGLLTADGGNAMGRCLDALADLGAVGVEWAVLDAQHFGLPQRRPRVFVVAWFDHGRAGTSPLLPLREGSEGDPRASEPEGSTEDPGFPRPGTVSVAVKAARAQTNQDHESWRTDTITPTLNVFDNGNEGRATVLMVDWLERVRRLTPRECERLQGWPDDHTRWGAGRELSDSFRYAACGNGVAAPVAEWVARCLSSGF